jgi:hypothetical protein
VLKIITKSCIPKYCDFRGEIKRKIESHTNKLIISHELKIGQGLLRQELQ